MKLLLMLVFIFGAASVLASDPKQVTCQSSEPHDPNITYEITWYPGEQILPSIIKNTLNEESTVILDKYSVGGVPVNLKLCEVEYWEDDGFIFWFSCEMPGDRVIDGQLQLTFDDDNNFSADLVERLLDIKLGECK